jgi:hypothetical protein
VCTKGDKIGNLVNVGVIYKKIFYRGITKHTNFAGGIDLFTLIIVKD